MQMNQENRVDASVPLPAGYELERRLGVGSFGSIVAVARQPPHHHKVAVKTIDKRRWKADDVCGGLYAIKQEAQALKELTAHPNIIGFIDAVETDDYYHLITQHNTGGDLYEHLYETTYTFTEEDLMSEDEWGDDMDQSITPRGGRTLFLNEREPPSDGLDSANSDHDKQRGINNNHGPMMDAVRRRERQGMQHPGAVLTESPRGQQQQQQQHIGQRSPRRVLEMKEYGGRLSDQEAQPLFRQLVRALQYCHSHGIAHRDLKPENVFLDDNQRVLLADFGLCMHFTPEQRTFVPCCGSMLYTAPEVIKEQPYVGPEIDIWGLGILLYEMLCGCTPFQADTDEATRQRILSGAVTFPDHLSSQARALISGMLQVDPALRLDLNAIKKHPWNLSAPQLAATSYLSPRGLISPRMLMHRNRDSAASASSPKPFSLNLMPAALAPSRTIPSPRYDTTSPRRMAVPRPLINPDNADCLIAIPGGADCEMPTTAATRPRPPSASPSSSPRGPTPAQLRVRPALWHSPQLCSPDPSPRGPAGLGLGLGLVSPRSFLSPSASASLLSPRSRLSPGSPRESSAAASKIYYSLMTMEEERRLPRGRTTRAPLTSGAANGDGAAEGEESDTDEDEDDSDYSESESENESDDDNSDNKKNSDTSDENETRSSNLRERLKIGRIDLSVVQASKPIPSVVVVAEEEGTADVHKAEKKTKHPQENTDGKPAKKEHKEASAPRDQTKKKKKKKPTNSRESFKDPRAPIYSAQRDKVTVVDFVSTIRASGKQQPSAGKHH
ncbi:protein kinase domain containing protein [Acanthamoeba castellanii str. Neff]|uniref:non-specific serine/threonine protein kinase n=2 Tax=Acanthamoeba castellanii (strain ATCC 30010 / Neff) TaxID=1257118 RepID=L8GTD3_ACACF|nr:protein kinase domain containing protein [Acanthamoeba castellanii str. Neff]ELR16265.1 protein kinase domain containing protein [Acanthamoeba castellanii str. Neff]